MLSARILKATSGSGRSSAIDGLRADLAQRLQTMVAVRRPVAVVLADGDDRIEKAAERLDDVHQPLHVRLRRIALEWRRLDAIDRQRRQEHRGAADRLTIRRQHGAAIRLNLSRQARNLRII